MSFKYSKSNTFYIGFLLFLHIQSVSSMDLLLAGQTVKQTNSLTSPVQTLCQLFGISGLERQELKDVRFMIAREIVGEGGWWYKHATWQDERECDGLVMSPCGNLFATHVKVLPKRYFPHYEDECYSNVSIWNVDGNLLKRLSFPSEVYKMIFLDKERLVANCETHGQDETTCFCWNFNVNPANATEHHKNLIKSDLQPRRGHMIEALGCKNNKLLLITCCHEDSKLYLYTAKGQATALGTISLDDEAGNSLIDSESEVIISSEEKVIKAFDFNGELLGVVKDEDRLFQLVVHNGNVLASYRNGKIILWNPKTNALTTITDNNLGEYGTSKWLDIHPTKQFYAIVDPQESLNQIDRTVVRLWNKQGVPVLKFMHESRVRNIKFNSRGILGVACIEKKDNTLWQEFEKPTLDQVLLKLLLLRYVNTGIKNWKNFDLCNNPESIVEWITRSFNVQEECVKNAWNGFPLRMQEALIRTLLYKSGCTY